MANGDDILNQKLAEEESARSSRYEGAELAAPQPVLPGSMRTTFDFIQWSAEPNETFRPSGQRRPILPAGAYGIGADDRGLFFSRKKVLTDDLIELDDTASIRVLAGIRTFWQSEAEYLKRGIIYKRGVLLWGPAGSGKTATLMLLTNELIANDGIVVICEEPKLTVIGVEALRRIEPTRPLIVVFEDVDELIARCGEHGILALLDGEHQVSNVVNIATTNYPERLGARIVNRPSRFDERIFIDMPNQRGRMRYLRHATRNESLGGHSLEQWVGDTEGFSVAHLRELVVAVFCLKQDYREVIERLSKMSIQPKSPREFGSPGGAGFGLKQCVANLQASSAKW